MIPGKQETANLFKNPEQSQSFIEGKSTDFSKTAAVRPKGPRATHQGRQMRR